MKHATHAVLLGMILTAIWLTIQVNLNALTDNAMLLISGILFGLSCLVTLAALFLMPELPRLKREKGRTPPHFEMWVMLLFYLVSGVLLFMDAFAVLEQGQPVRYAAAGAALSPLAACISVANERMCICWNDEGFVLRTALGNIRHFRWEHLTGHQTYRGVTTLWVGRRSYTANLSGKQVVSFLRASVRR